MPKSSTGARAPKNYDPRFAPKKAKPRHKSAGAGTPDSADSGERAASRFGARSDGPKAATRGGSSAGAPARRAPKAGGFAGSRDDRGRDDRGRDERGPSRFDRDERPARTFRDDDARGPRTGRAERDTRAPGGPRAERRAAEFGDRREIRDRDDSRERATGRDRDNRATDNRAPADRAIENREPRDYRGRDGAERPFRARDDRPRTERSRDDRRPAARTDRDDRRPAARTDRDDRGRDERGSSRFNRDDRPRTDRPRTDRFRDDRDARPRGRDDRDQRSGGFTPPEDVVLDRLDAAVVAPEDMDGISFGDLGLGDNICRQLAQLGAASPFPIQAATIPIILTGRDVLGRGRTGSGKTIAFGAPLVERLLADGPTGRKQGRPARALIMAPTRELAMQIDRTVQPIARSVGLFTTTIYGGVPQHKQVLSLRKGVDIIIATPGRLEDLVEQRMIDLSHISITVLDEADHMCDLGFLEPVQRILRQTDPDGQRLLFSATLDSGVSTIVKEFLNDPGIYEVSGEDQDSATIDHKVFTVESRDKVEIIAELAAHSDKVLVFTRTRAFADMLADGLDDRGVPATSLHGDLNQAKRTRNLERLSSGRVHVLVATDVAARGIHVDDVDLVVQADPPDDYKSYMHRAGRTGRAGREGTVVTLIPKARQRRMNELLERAGITAPAVAVRPGDDAIVNLLG
jgi:superfamily II DNA/RNA helicase